MYSINELLELQKTSNPRSQLYKVIAQLIDLYTRDLTLVKIKPIQVVPEQQYPIPAEPIFVLRAQDVCAPATIRYWHNRVLEKYRADGCNNDTAHKSKLEEAWTKAKLMDDWKGFKKVPD